MSDFLEELAQMSDFLEELAEAEYEARLRRKAAANDATEEYLLDRLRFYQNPHYKPVSVAKIALKYGVTRQMIEHRIFALRQALIRQLEEEEDQSVVEQLGHLLNGMAAAMADLKGKRR